MIVPPHFFQIGPLKYLTQLPDYGERILLFAIMCHVVYFVGGLVSQRFSQDYRKLDHAKKCSWCIHIVSIIFSCFIISAAIPIYYIKENQMDRLLGTTHYSRCVFSYAIGYFLWDLFISIYFIRDIGPAFVFHASSCFCVFLFGLLPFAQGFCPLFLLFETSTIFLNIHWFCDKTGRAGSRLQWINGMILLLTFFIFRLVNGTYGMADFIYEAYTRRSELPSPYLWQSYTVAAFGLGSLNFYWFSLMVRSVFSRFKAKKEKNKKE